MFTPADPTSRIPSWLQNRTKENFIWQLAMTAVVLGAYWAKDAYDARKIEKERAALKTLINS